MNGSGSARAPLPHAVHTGTMVARFETPSYSVAENVYSAGTRSRSHEHESAFLVVALSGETIPVVRGTEHIVSARGNLTLIPAGWHHSHTVLAPTRVLTMDVHPASVAGLHEMGADFSKLFLHPDPDVLRFALQLHEEIRHPDPFSALQVEALITEMCAALMRSRRGDDSSGTPRWLHRVRKLIEERYRDEYSLADLAAEAKVHPVHVARAFRRSFGETPGEYTRRLRIKEARSLLESSSRSLTEIAVDVGYHDQSHFSRAFEKVVGTTPGRYRRSHKER